MLKRIVWILLLASGLQTSWGFSVEGPIANGGDAWQAASLGYGPPFDVVAPKNLGEEYRRNIPTNYYAFDANFYDYFGPEGAASVEATFAMLNSLTDVDSYSQQLTEFSLETRQMNYQAQALGLLDLKSYTLTLMMSQVGLANPIAYAWTLHNRTLPPGAACPNYFYTVVQRNFDFYATALNQLPYSPYINNTLYNYRIREECPVVDRAKAIPFAVDKLANIYSPVASEQIEWGDYFIGLTRDDAAGMRYLLSTNNINWETPAADSLLVITNFAAQALFPASIATNSGYLYPGDGTYYGTASLSALLSYASTNNLATIQARFPGVQATVVSNYYTTVWITNTVAYYTNYYGEAIGSPAHLIVTSVPTLAVVPNYVYHFDNIIIWTNYSLSTTSYIQTITVGPQNGAPIGSPNATNVTTTTVSNSVASGEFYILPTNSPCGVDILEPPLLTLTNYTTNVLVFSSSTNVTTTGTNTTTSTTTTTNSTQSYTQQEVTPSLSHVFLIHPVTCGETNAISGLYRGIGKIRYVRADFDSMLGQYWQPITNDYTMQLITNGVETTRSFRRIVTQPDFLFSALDLTPGPSSLVIQGMTQSTVPPFDTANVYPGLAGPGTITPATTISFNKDGPLYYNQYPDQLTGNPYFKPGNTPGSDLADSFFSGYFTWASFDGTTNAPTVYPNGTSLDNLARQILVQFSPATLPLGSAGDAYKTQFSATGGGFTAPFTWTSTELPAGLTLTPGGSLSGTPTVAGTYDFTLTLTDVNSRSVQWNYTIIIQ